MKVSDVKPGRDVCIKMPNCDAWVVISGQNAIRNYIRWYGNMEVVKTKSKTYLPVKNLDFANDFPQGY